MSIKHFILPALAAASLALSACGEKVNPAQAALDNIMARRSVRSFTDQDVTPEQVETLLRAAMAAPTGMNLQPWRFVVVRDQHTKEQLCKRSNDFIATAPVVIVVCAEMITIDDKPNKNWTADCAAAAENLLLAAQAMGLGACWTACHPYFDRTKDTQKALRMPDNYRPYCIIPVGYPDNAGAPKDKWHPEYIQYERWQNKDAGAHDSLSAPHPGRGITVPRITPRGSI